MPRMRPLARYWLRIRMVPGIALAAFVYGILLYHESFIAGPGCCGTSRPYPNPLQVERLADAQDPEMRDPSLQRQAAITILQARPADVDAWLRLAYAERLARNAVTPASLEALDKSYAVTAYAGSAAPWRVAFALDDWHALSPQLRKDVLREIGIIKKIPYRLARLKEITGAVSNPDGRWIAAVMGILPGA